MAALLLCANEAVPQRVDENLWGTDGSVFTIARSGNTLYVGGDFNAVGPNSGGGVPVDRVTGEPLPSFPRVTGVVRTVVPDGAGGWFIGGTFVAVGGVPRANIAHILASGRVADWSPDADGEILVLARSGETLYAGGFFTHIGGQPRSYVAALDVGTGQATGWDPEPNLQVRALLPYRGNVYIGGDFTAVGTITRYGVAQLDSATGQPAAWNPDVSIAGSRGSVRALAALGDTMYLGGDFTQVGTQSRGGLAAVSIATGVPTAWNPGISGLDNTIYGDPYVAAMSLRGNTVYVVGHFTSIGAQARSGVAQVDLATGQVLLWNPAPPASSLGDSPVTCLTLHDSTAFLGGWFAAMGGQDRPYCAEVSLATGLATRWNPRSTDAVFALGVAGAAVFVGGYFFSIGDQWRERKGLAALDVTTGAVKDWDPHPDGLGTWALAVTHGRVYVGGYFSFIGGQTRYGLAALDTLTGGATEWNPTANSVVGSLAVTGDTLYVGGYFTTMSDQPRGRLASFDLNTGELTSWNPNAASDVYGLAVRGDVVYVAGFFWTIGGLTRKGIAAVDGKSGAILDWNPQSDDWCTTVALAGDTVFVGGRFNTIGGQPRQNLAALDAATGGALDWSADTNLGTNVSTIAIVGDTMFVGGGFWVIGGEPREGLAALDLRTGTILPWDAGLSNLEWGFAHAGASVILPVGNTLYIGGGFQRIGDIPAATLAAITFGTPPGPEPVPTWLALAPIAPNPLHSEGTIRFALPAAGPVNLAVYDVQGRRVASLLNHSVLTAGVHNIGLRAGGWREGFYFCRLEAGGVAATQKFVVLR